MTTRDVRHRRAAARLHDVAVSLAAEVLAKGGSLDNYDLTDAEKDEATVKARTFWRDRQRTLLVTMRHNVSKSRRVGRLTSTEP